MAHGTYRYVIRVRVDDIAAGHFLPNYEGDCARPHGHNWYFEAEIGADQLHRDMVVDFVKVKAIVKALDHCLLNDVADLMAEGHQPTCERLAEWLAGQIQALLGAQPNRPHLLSLTVDETSRNRLTYHPDS